MFLEIVISYLVYGLVTAFTPGPNNIVALYAVSQKGWRGGRKVLIGMAVGFLCVMSICAILCYTLARYIPSITEILKYVGAAYILWLAFHVALSKPSEKESKVMTFWSGFFLQFVNVKIILYAITIYTGYVIPVNSTLGMLMSHAVVLTLIGLSGNMTWATAGGLFQKLLNKYYKSFNIAMGVVLAYCAISLALG